MVNEREFHLPAPRCATGAGCPAAASSTPSIAAMRASPQVPDGQRGWVDASKAGPVTAERVKRSHCGETFTDRYLSINAK